jgi:hypothetical protein
MASRYSVDVDLLQASCSCVLLSSKQLQRVHVL